MRTALALLALTAIGCGDDDDDTGPTDPCASGDTFIGDPSGTPDIEVGEISYEGTFRPIGEGDVLTLFTPPQGGKIALVSAHLTNMDGCGATLTARLRDPVAEGQPVAVHEGRTVRYVAMEDRPGWGNIPTGPNAFTILAAGSNLPACHNYATRDMDGCSWLLDVTVEDRGGLSVRKTFNVGLTCPEDDPGAMREDERAECECECAARFDTRDCDDLSIWQDVEPVCEAAE